MPADLVQNSRILLDHSIHLMSYGLFFDIF